MTTANDRQRFETWITQSPYERDIERYGDDATRFAWPGQYVDHAVQIAWEAWQEAQSVKLPARLGPRTCAHRGGNGWEP